MKKSKVLVIIVILIIGVWFVESVAMPFYYFLFANVNVLKYPTGVCANVTTEELEKYPALEKVINGEGCSGTLCVVTPDEWGKIHNFTDNLRRNDPHGGCIKFETYDGFYNIETIRP